MQIKELNVETIKDAWLVIKECSHWLLESDLDHWATYYTFDRVAEKLKTAKVFCLYEGKTPIATVTLSNRPPEYYSEKDRKCFSFVANDKTMFMSSLAVRPDFQGRGYAKALISFCEGYAKEKGFLAIGSDARRKYAKLIDFYKGLGFIEVGDMDDEGESYVLFERVIEGRF